MWKYTQTLSLKDYWSTQTEITGVHKRCLGDYCGNGIRPLQVMKEVLSRAQVWTEKKAMRSDPSKGETYECFMKLVV